MATDQQIINIIRSMTNTGLTLGLQTIKAGVVTADRSRIEPLVRDMVNAGELTEIKKNRFKKRKTNHERRMETNPRIRRALRSE